MISAHENCKFKGGGGRGGGGGGGVGTTIRIGATGKVRALMMQELNSNIKPSSNTSASTAKSHNRRRLIQTAPVSISCGVSTKRLQQMISSSDLKVSGSSTGTHDHQIRQPSIPRKKENARRASQQIPMLEFDDSPNPIDKTPTRGKLVAEKKLVGRQIVEIVDLNCRDYDGDWSNPITNQLRRLSFSKLSE